ncbi:MAG TPA: hypothetical protein VFJ43_16240, partial [Bacteroidia bacterium]|nr:hypothetical protein [Bacteroidia bacterium]
MKKTHLLLLLFFILFISQSGYAQRGVRSWTASYTYDEKGNLTEMDTYNYGQDGGLLDAFKHKTKNKYDDKGNLVSSSCKSGSNFSYEYDNKGNKTVENEGNDLVPEIGKRIWKYNDEGRIIEMDEYVYNNANSYKRIHTYDNSGNEIGYESYSQTNILQSKQTCLYDSLGNLLEEDRYSSDGICLSKKTFRYEYDKQGNWIRKTSSFCKIGSPCKPEKVTLRTIEYYPSASVNLVLSVADINDLILKKNDPQSHVKNYLRKNGLKGSVKKIKISDYYAKDSSGIIVPGEKVILFGDEIDLLDLAGNLIQNTVYDGIHPSSRENYKFDEKGNLIETDGTNKFDENEEEQSSANGTSTISSTPQSSNVTAYVPPSEGTPVEMKNFSDWGVNSQNYHSYTGPNSVQVYQLLDALYQGNMNAAPTIKIADCCIRDGDVAMACQYAWAVVVYA